jgi:hypothetical protein
MTTHGEPGCVNGRDCEAIGPPGSPFMADTQDITRRASLQVRTAGRAFLSVVEAMMSIASSSLR